MKKYILIFPMLLLGLLIGGNVLAGNNGAVFTKTNYTDTLEAMVYNNCDNIGCGSWGDVSLSFYKADGTFITDINHIDYNTPYLAGALSTIINNTEVGQVLLGLDSDLANTGCFANYSFPLSTCKSGLDGNGINYYLSNLTFNFPPPPTPSADLTATSSLILVGNAMVISSTDIALNVISLYWPFVLIIAIIGYLLIRFVKFPTIWK
jgi:hypothetical protein